MLSVGVYCAACEAGKKQVNDAGTGAPGCVSCLLDHPDGYYSAGALAVCTQCPPGTEKRLQNNLPTECLSCVLDDYSRDGTLCQPCPPLMVPNAARDDCVCPRGSYWAGWGRVVCHEEKFVKDDEAADWFLLGSRNDSCVQCTGDCLNCNRPGGPLHGFPKTVGARILDGYMMSEELMDVYDETNGLVDVLVTRNVHKCPGNGKRCVGEVPVDSMADCTGDDSGSGFSEPCVAADPDQLLRCLAGSDGALCGACAAHHTLSALDQSCTPCDSWSVDNMAVAIIIAVTIVTAVMVKYCLAPCVEKAKVQMDKMEDSGFVTKFKIMVSLSQVVSEMPFSLAMSYPDMFLDLLRFLGIFRIDLLSGLKLDCLFATDFYSAFIMSMMLIPIGLVMVQLPRLWTGFKICLRLTCRCSCKCLRPGHLTSIDEVVDAAAESKKAADSAFDRSFLVFFLMYTGVTRQVFRMFDCRPLDDGAETQGTYSDGETFALAAESWHQDDFATSCTTDKHAQFITIAWAMVFLFPLGVPAFMFITLFLNRKWLSDAAKPLPPLEKRGWYIGDREKFEFLVKDYKPQYYYWEVIEILRKLLLTGIIIFIDPGSTAQIFVACNISFFFFALQMACQPFFQSGNNHLKTAAEIQTFVTLLVSIVLRSELKGERLTRDHYDILLVVINLSLAPIPFVFMISVICCKNAKVVAKSRWSRVRGRVSDGSLVSSAGDREQRSLLADAVQLGRTEADRARVAAILMADDDDSPRLPVDSSTPSGRRMIKVQPGPVTGDTPSKSMVGSSNTGDGDESHTPARGGGAVARAMLLSPNMMSPIMTDDLDDLPAEAIAQKAAIRSPWSTKRNDGRSWAGGTKEGGWGSITDKYRTASP